MNLPGAILRRCMAAALGLLALSCSSPGVSYTTAVTTIPAALVPTPEGPGLSGPPLGRRRGAAELSFHHAPTVTGTLTRDQGGLAHVHLGTRGAARIYFNINGLLELGPSFEWSFPVQTPSSPDISDELGNGWFRGGLNTRLFFVRERPWTLGVNLDLLVSRIPFRSTVRGTTTRYDDGTCTSLFGCTPRAPSSLVIRQYDDFYAHALVRGDFRVGLFGGGRLGERVWLLGGVLLQTQPQFTGTRSITLQCERADTCTDLATLATPDGDAVIGTLWAGVGVDLGRATFFARIDSSPMSPAAQFQAAPIGLSLASRVNF